MLQGIDHLVILVADLEVAAKSYRAQGFTVVEGGRHPTGTHNALIGLADGSYLELLAFLERRPDSRWWSKLAQGDGLIAVCLRTNDLRTEIAGMRTAGINMGNPQPLSRERPDGYLLKWQLSLYEGEHADLLPFLIEDETPRDERVPKERRHSNGATGIDAVTFAVDDLDVVRRWCGGAFRQPGEAVARPELAASGLRFRIGPHHLEFLAPQRESGSLSAWLRARGPSPFSVALATASGGRVCPQ